jgi:hypothetical protein
LKKSVAFFSRGAWGTFFACLAAYLEILSD